MGNGEWEYEKGKWEVMTSEWNLENIEVIGDYLRGFCICKVIVDMHANKGNTS